MICEDEFMPVNSSHKYCSGSCREVVHQTAIDAVKGGRFIILNRDKFQCAYCGKTSYRDGSELHIDHIVPQKLGGKDTASNLITSCVQCNVEKQAYMLFNIDDMLAEVASRNKECDIPPEKPIRLRLGKLN